jgi:hypothetical protein
MFRPHRILPVLAATLVLGTVPACASQGGFGRYPRTARVDDRAYRNGYAEGRSQGQDDARRGRAFDYDRHGEYRRATDGYNGRGNRNAYRDLFRRGFAAGYNDGYGRYAGRSRQYPPSGPIFRGPGRDRGVAVYRSPAAENGFRDGYDEGRKDGRDDKRPDPVRESRYREGDRDYESRYGSRDLYKREYRAAFRQGYEQGYREGRR